VLLLLLFFVLVLCAYNSCCSFFLFVVLDLVAEASSCLILDTAQDIPICPMKQSFLDAPGHSVCSLFLNLVFEFECAPCSWFVFFIIVLVVCALALFLIVLLSLLLVLCRLFVVCVI
jgi:hypothetical protein